MHFKFVRVSFSRVSVLRYIRRMQPTANEALLRKKAGFSKRFLSSTAGLEQSQRPSLIFKSKRFLIIMDAMFHTSLKPLIPLNSLYPLIYTDLATLVT